MTEFELLSALETEAGYKFKRVNKLDYSDNEAQYTYDEINSAITGLRLPRRAFCVPNTVFLLRNLKELDLSLVKINVLSDDLANLVNLEKINLYNTEIRALPQCIGELRALRNINLAQSPIEVLPDSICNLNNLEKLTLWGTRIRDLPEDIGNLKKMKSLDLSECRLRSLPRSIVELNIDFEDSESFDCIKITKLSIDDKQILSRIKTGKFALMEYFESEKYLNQNCDYESKIVLLGNGTSGKTCLMHAILNNYFNANQAKTEGISVSKWIVEDNETRGCIHIWDFGGQETYRPLCSLFLSKCNLCIIVLNGRSDETPDLWLEFIQLYAPSSPIIIVINRIDESPKAEIDRNYYFKKYSNLKIVDVIRCSCKDYDKPSGNIQLLRETILTTLNSFNLKLMCDDNWRNFRKSLRLCKENYLTFTDLNHYWQQCNITDTKDQNSIIRKCCDYGIFLKQSNSSRYIVNLEWFSTAISKLFAYFEKHKLDFLIENASLYRYLYDIDNSYDSTVVDDLISALHDCKLCYSSREHIVVPYALSLHINEEFNQFSDYQKYIIKYRISSKFIFQFLLIHLIEYRLDDDHVWKNAIEISYNNANIFIEQNGKDIIIYFNEKNINKSVYDCLSFVITNLFQIHKDFMSSEIPFEVLIPYNKLDKEVTIIMEQIVNNGGQVVFAKDNATVTATNFFNGYNFSELHELLSKLKTASNTLNEEDRETAESGIQIIEDELQSKEPRKNYLKIALNVLNGIKGTTEFIAAVAAIAQFFQTIL